MKRNAFTLIELLIVIAILSFLTALFGPLLAGAQRRALAKEAEEKRKATIALTVSNLSSVNSSNTLSVTNSKLKQTNENKLSGNAPR